MLSGTEPPIFDGCVQSCNDIKMNIFHYIKHSPKLCLMLFVKFLQQFLSPLSNIIIFYICKIQWLYYVKKMNLNWIHKIVFLSLFIRCCFLTNEEIQKSKGIFKRCQWKLFMIPILTLHIKGKWRYQKSVPRFSFIYILLRKNLFHDVIIGWME